MAETTGVNVTSVQEVNSSMRGATGSQIVKKAKQYIGTPYKDAGTTPSGFDCSGFTQYVYKQCGVTISRTTKTQINNGRYVSKSSLKEGDLVFFQNTYAGCTNPSHVGIYVGGGQFIHCGSSGVKIADLNSNYWKPLYYSARRIL
ncbi:MAG: NlpC/P60 family protein [Clostridium sp.]|nr:NlpC/P60 family protein [Clostridium sp.]